MSGQEDHLHVPDGFFTPHHPIPTLPANTDRFLDNIFASPPHLSRHQLMDHEPTSNTLPTTFHQQPAMEFTEEKFLQLQALAERQAKMIEDGNAFQNQAALKLQDSQRQLEETQRNLTDLTAAFKFYAKLTEHRSSAPLGPLPLSPSHINIYSHRGNGYR